MNLESCACPLGCEANDVIVLQGGDRLHGVPGVFTVVKCQNCGLFRTNPRPTSDTIGDFYPPEYGPYQSLPAIHDKVSTLKRLLSWIFKPRNRDIPRASPGRLLEIGCATGSFLSEMRMRGWSVDGIEFSGQAASVAIESGHNVYIGSVDAFRAEPRSYDAIVGWMVLEHLHDPVGTLKKLRNLAKDHAYLAISVPDASAMEARIFGDAWYALQLPTHLYHFTPSTIQKLLEVSGWRVTRIIWHRNPANLLKSMIYVCQDRGWLRFERLLNDILEGHRFRKSRSILGVLLGLFRQSGRMTVWAKPITEK